MGKKYKYDFYFKVDERANFDGSYLKYTYERDLPLDDEEYKKASIKLIDSVANDLDISKDYITPVSIEEFNEKSKENQ